MSLISTLPPRNFPPQLSPANPQVYQKKKDDVFHIETVYQSVLLWIPWAFGLRLVGGFNPFEKYQSKWESSPSRNEHTKYLKPPPKKYSVVFCRRTIKKNQQPQHVFHKKKTQVAESLRKASDPKKNRQRRENRGLSNFSRNLRSVQWSWLKGRNVRRPLQTAFAYHEWESKGPPPPRFKQGIIHHYNPFSSPY